MKKIALFFAIALLSIACNNEKKTAEEQNEERRIVSLNGAVSEVLVNPGEEEHSLGVAVTSPQPKSLTEAPTRLGHVRSITVEPLVAVQPTVVYASDQDINPDLMKQIKDANITLHLINQEF